MLTTIMRWLSAVAVIVAAVLSASAGARQGGGAGELTDLLARIGARVEQYYARARTIVCIETVVLQPLARDLTADGRARRLVYELRVEWEPSSADGQGGGGNAGSAGTVVRRLLTVDGRPPRPQDKPGCMDPRAVSPEPLGMLLPGRSTQYAFVPTGTAVTGGRPSVRLDYRPIGNTPPAVEWREDCVTIELNGRSRGRVWVDAATDDVLRIDEYLVGPVDIGVPVTPSRRDAPPSMTIERADSTIEYRPVRFSNPDETWLMPAAIESVTVVRNAAVPRQRTRQLFSDYRRFTTAGRVVD
jgi:hypothetical protein